MFFKSNLFRFSSAFCLALSLSFAVFADTIRLKDGSVIKGKIVSFGGSKFTVLIADGTRRRQLTFSVGEVESISFDTAAVSDNVSGSATKNGGDVNNSPVSAPTPAPVPAATPAVNPPVYSPAAAVLKPVTINVPVLADNSSNGWTNSGFVVQKGQRIRVGGSGRISLGGGRSAAPEGISTLPDTGKLMANEATGGLIAVVGDDNNEFIFIGAGREFTATRDGALFLGVNEGNLTDNSGRFDVKVDIYPKD